MNFQLYLLILVFAYEAKRTLQKQNKIEWSFPDIKKAIIEGDTQYDLKAFKSSLNDDLIRTKKYTHLAWYSIGNLEFASDEIEFNSAGFLIKLNFLTNENKKVLTQEIKEIYDIDVDVAQIINLPFDKFECEIEVRDENDPDYLDSIIGNAKQFNKYPINVYFKADRNLKSRYLLQKVLNQSQESLHFKCMISYEDLFKENFEIQYSKTNSVFVKKPEIVQKYDKNLEDMKQSIENLVEKQSKIVTDFAKVNQRFDLYENDKNSEQLIEKFKENTEKRLVELVKSAKTNQISDKLKELMQGLETEVKGLQSKRDEINRKIEDIVKARTNSILESKQKIENLNETLNKKIDKMFIDTLSLVEKLNEKSKENYDSITTKINSTVVEVESLEEKLIQHLNKPKKVKKFTGDFDRDLGKHSSSIFQVIELSNNLIASGSSDKTIKIWDMDDDSLVATLTGHTGTVSSLIKISDKLIATGSYDKTIKIWDLENDGSLVTTLNNHGEKIFYLVRLSNDLMASGDAKGRIFIWDTTNFNFVRELKYQGNAHSSSVDCMIEMKSGELVSAGDNVIKIWVVSTGSLKMTLKGHTNTINALGLTPSGQILSASSDGILGIWTVDLNRNSFSLNYYSYGYSELMSMAVFKNGDILIGSKNSKIYYITNNNGNYGTTKYTLEGHTDSIYSLALLSSGDLVSASKDSTIKIWN